MTREMYNTKRETLMADAQKLLDESKMDEFKAKTKEIETLDAQFDTEAKAQANLNALKDKQPAIPMSNAAVDVSGGTVVASIGNTTVGLYDTDEYKLAFMRNVISGAAIPAKFSNTDANTLTTDVGSVIPTTTLQKIYEKMEATGMILPLVTRTSYKGGLAIPTSTVKPTATWVSEGAGSDKQKKTTGTITFGYYKLRCAISMSLETTVVSYPMFESTFVANVSEAMVKAQEQAIISGTGVGQPKGILAETVVSGQNIDIARANSITYADLVAAEAALPQAYDGGAVWCMTKKTYLNQIIGLVDSSKQPISRVNYGLSGRPEYTLLGRRVVLVGDYMDSYAAAPVADTIVAFMFNFSDYVLNTNMGITVKRYTEDSTDDEILKAIMLTDGKVVDKNSLVTITKKSA